jgi:nitrous-oxide reductase
VKNLVTDALDQYGKIPEQKKLSDAAVKEGDFEKAVLFENMIWQYMVKTADVGIRAKDLLVKFVATKQSPEAAKGETAFHEGGCSGCHVIGKVSSGPDLTGVLGRHENGTKWVADFIKNPKEKFDDPYVKAMIDYFNLRMPDQHMKDEEVKNIIEYLKWVDSNANLF